MRKHRFRFIPLILLLMFAFLPRTSWPQNAEKNIQLIFNENLPAMLYLIDWSVQNFSADINPSTKRGRRHGPRANLKDKTKYGREARCRRDDKATTQSSKLKANEPKTSGVKSKTIDICSKAINVRKCSPLVIKEHKRKKDWTKTNRLTKSTEKY